MELEPAHPSPRGTGHPELEALVQRTCGPQPWRRVFHAASGVVAYIALEVLRVPRSSAIVLLAVLLGAMVSLDAVRLRYRKANAAFFKVFRLLASPREAQGPASSTWYAAGILIAVAFFPTEAATSGILVLAVADPVASYGGRRWGRVPFLGATLEGSALFAVTAFSVLALRHDIAAAAVTALVLGLTERLSWPLDDNLTLPVLGAAVLTLLEATP